ncbi:LysR family transcriptional regulator [Nisaea sp.]|uniref:LysR family transcriptional regulator n=1 Tax=Nisaea sp. TaxID=2024842 RepID=UPI00329A5531
MQIRNWYDLQILAAVRSGGSIAAAARLLGIDQTTVGRRLNALQEGTGVNLLVRTGDRRLVLTPAGEEVAERALAMEREAIAASALLGEQRLRVAGTVRLSAVPVLVNRILAPAAASLLSEHPDLTLELIPENRDLNLTRREADLALRMARPESGGSTVKIRKLGALRYDAYGTNGGATDTSAPWILFEDAMAHLPHARWLERRSRRNGQGAGGLRVCDAETALEAVAAGLGYSILPAMIADRDHRLAAIAMTGAEPLPEREVWLLSHARQPNAAAIGAVTVWLEGVFQS